MADYLFVPQSVLDKWSEQGRIQVDGNVLTILGEQKSFALTSAVRFIKMEAGDDKNAPMPQPKAAVPVRQAPAHLPVHAAGQTGGAQIAVLATHAAAHSTRRKAEPKEFVRF